MQAPIETLDPQHFMTGEFLYNDVKAYAALGEHRTGAPADRKTSEWLSKQVEGFGFTSKPAPFRVRQFFLDSARLLANGREIPCFPLWFPRATGVAPLHAPIAVRDLVKGHIAIAHLPKGYAITAEHMAVLQPLIDAGAAGIIAVTPTDSGDLVALNSPANAEPWPIPIILVSPVQEVAIRASFDLGIWIQGRDEPRAEAFNVVATLGTGKKHIVISTPSSGWFRCAGERGPGIALWLALARWSSHLDSKLLNGTRYTFVATSGHELGEQGMHHFFAEQAPRPNEVTAWLHLGSSIAAKNSKRRLMTNRNDWLPLLGRNLGVIQDLKPEVTQQPPGELGQLTKLGYRCFGIAGSHSFFHSPGDGPEMTSGAMIEPVGQALLRTLVELQSDAQ